MVKALDAKTKDRIDTVLESLGIKDCEDLARAIKDAAKQRN